MGRRRKLRIKDGIKGNDLSKSGLRGHVIFGKNPYQYKYTDPYGNEAFRTEFEEVLYEDTNIVPIGGYQFAFNKLFNIGLDQLTTLRVGDLNDEAPQMRIGVPRTNYDSVHYNAETVISNDPTITRNLRARPGVNIPALNFIFGFMMGDGGAREDGHTAIAPNYKTRTLNRAIPFRIGAEDGTIDTALWDQPYMRSKYFGATRNIGTGHTARLSYFVKTFDHPEPRIVHVWVTDNPNEFRIVDDSVFASTSSLPIESYVEMNISVDQEDGRDFFLTQGASPRVNEFGLVSGWYNPLHREYESLRLFTHFTRPSIALAEGDSISAIYRLYAR